MQTAFALSVATNSLTDPDDPVEPAPTTPAPVVTPAPTPRPTMPVVSDVPIDQTPAPTPTPVFTQVPAVETVHGVKAEDEVPMVETLVTVVDTIAKEDASASIQIVNVECVVTTEEKQALDTLPVKEQILTFLSVIGFEEQVDVALGDDRRGAFRERAGAEGADSGADRGDERGRVRGV